jgi:hypothetical protein
MLQSSKEEEFYAFIASDKGAKGVKFVYWYIDFDDPGRMSNCSDWFIDFIEDKTGFDTMDFGIGEEYYTGLFEIRFCFNKLHVSQKIKT